MPIPAFRVLPLKKNGVTVINPSTGKPVMGITPDPMKQHVRPYWLTSDPVLTTLAAQGTVGDTVDLSFNIDTQGHFDWEYILGQSDYAFTIEFFDTGKNRYLQNRPIHNQCCVGVAGRPFKLPDPYFFNVGQSSRELTVRIRNLSANANNIRLALYGRRFYHHEAPPDIALEMVRKFERNERAFSYFLLPKEETNAGVITPVAALGNTTFTFESDDSADTLLTKLMHYSTGTFNCLIRERSTNRTLMNLNVHSNMQWGNAEFPGFFSDTYLLERLRQLIVTVTDLSNAENTIYLAMAGVRLQYR
jgi:hypothetical protein